MKGAFEIIGVDPAADTVVVEIDRSILGPIANLLEVAPDAKTNRTGVAVRTLGNRLRDVATVLYGNIPAERFGFDVLDPEDPEEESLVLTGTRG